MNQKIDFTAKIKQSSLVFRLKGIAQAVFGQWIDNAEQAFSMPAGWADNIRNNDVTAIFIEHLAEALESLVDDKHIADRQFLGWSYGYVCGRVQGSLDTSWANQYIVEHSKGYRDLFKLLALKSFFNHDKDAQHTVYGYYQYYLAEYSVDGVLDADPGDNVVSISAHDNGCDVRLNQFRTELDELLQDVFTTRYEGLFDSTLQSCCPGLVDVLTKESLEQIVGEEYFNG